MKLHVLGNGGPRPAPKGEKFGTSCVLEFGDERIMFDCGGGATYKLARMDMRPTQINTLFLTHHHSDHIVDFPCFALLRFDLDPGDLPPLKVYGPAPTADFAEKLFGDDGVFQPDIIARQKHPVSHHGHIERGGTMPRPGMKVQAQDVDATSVITGKNWQVTAAKVPHVGPFLTSLAYRIDTPVGSLLFLGDAADCPDLRPLAKGVDTLVTGVINRNFKENPADAVHGVSADISEVVDIARGGNIRQLVLIHGSPLSAEFREKLKQGYDGKTFDGIVHQPREMTTVEL